MDVAAASFRGISENGIDQRDHRSIHGRLLQFLEINVVVFLNDLHLAIAEFLQYVIVTDATESLIEGLLNRGRGSQHYANTVSRYELDFVDRDEICRV